MADNPNKKGLDAKRVSQQPHEQACLKKKAKKSGASGKAGGAKKSKGR
jgi:hypothetical protein